MTNADWTHQHATELRNHWWWRPGWRVGTRFYAWHLTFDNADGLHRLVDYWQRRLRPFEGLDLVPRRWLHLTMQGVGMVEDVPDKQLDRIVDAVRQRLAMLSTVSVEFSRPLVRAEAIAMPPHPMNRVVGIRSAVRSGMADVLGEDGVPERPDGFQPHVSLAYVNRDQPASDIVASVASTDSPPPANVDIAHAFLIEMHRDNRMYEWRTIATASVQTA